MCRMDSMTDLTSGPAGTTWHESPVSMTTSGTKPRRGIAKITICRPEVHNAFRPQTLIEIASAERCPRGRVSRGHHLDRRGRQGILLRR